ncbi:winged helix-turn-helix domain-containing protein [Pseudoalteromonas luteoviolacea]|uniref:winged helix-turn-helix domain-containing protein n=1 Tax=Pseudoalteromonas luteoviolacea TaxID=43657 RepID=UPI001EEF050E|nr:winged helix-turn-helix domain-containing protein [Pseudoalteromonas luteoviolacea]MCF6440249.1 winged helix-turn-helix domain-containing protein [Pseudoalteromonas luteoviolacea]
MEYQFSNAVLNTRSQSFEVDGKKAVLEDRTFKLLAYLIDTHPKVCSQEELVAYLWPDSVVSPWSLPRLISDTRSLLRRLGVKQDVIFTVRGQGYKFNPEVTIRSANDTAQLELAILRAEHNSDGAHLKFWIGVTLLMCCVCIWLVINHGFVHEQTTSFKASEPVDAKGRILWVDDNPKNNTKEQGYFLKKKIGVYNTTSTQEALLLLSMYEYSVVISDMGRDGEPLAGLKLLRAMRAVGDETPFYVYTWVESDKQKEVIISAGGQGVATKKQELYNYVLLHFSDEKI